MLRDYLEQVRLLETDIYTMEESIHSLRALRRGMPEYRLPASKPVVPKKPDDPVLELPTKKGTVAGAFAITLATNAVGTIPYLIYRSKKAKRLQAEYDATIIQNQIKHDQALKEYEAQLSAYESQCSAYEQNYNAEKQKNELFNNNLELQITSLQSHLDLSRSALEQLYSLDIVYKKYRSLIAITMFCEYFDSGLRTELEGTTGMYDLYEQQLMGRLIINELSTVNHNLKTISFQLGTLSRQLTSIQRNQQMLYEEVAKANTIASSIKYSTERLLDNSEQLLNTSSKHLSAIQSATEMTAFQAEATTRRTDAIAKMVEYEFEAKHSPYNV